MSDYISRDSAIEELLSLAKRREARGAILSADEYEIIRWLNTLPAADVREVKRGKWEEMPHNMVWNADGIYRAAYKCSNCEQTLPFAGDFCPNCGADMRPTAEKLAKGHIHLGETWEEYGDDMTAKMLSEH